LGLQPIADLKLISLVLKPVKRQAAIGGSDALCVRRMHRIGCRAQVIINP
jgi:hypothetical protein